MSKKTILVVDDDPESYGRYERVFESCSAILSLDHARDGVQALEKLEKTRFDLILLDQVFSRTLIPVDRLYRCKDDGTIGLCPAGIEFIGAAENEQGLLILKVLRSQHISTPVIFVTNNVESAIGVQAQEAGANEYVSKSRLDDRTLIEMVGTVLGVNLRSLEEQIKLELWHRFPRVNETERNAMAAILSPAASPRRRRKLAFVNAVLNELTSQDPTIFQLIAAIEKLDATGDWKIEPVDPDELLRWTLDCFPSLPKCDWESMSSSPLRRRFKGHVGQDVWFLNIVRPSFSKASDETHLLTVNDVLPVEDVCVADLGENDPQWEGNQVVAYLEKGTTALPLNVFARQHAPLPTERIQQVLQGLASLVSRINAAKGHGMIGLDSMFVNEDNTVLIGDAPLWEVTSEEGIRQVEGLTSADPARRNIQSLASAADVLLTGMPGGLEKTRGDSEFFQFIRKCKDATWDLTTPIPAPPVSARFFHFGPFRSDLELNFFYQVKRVLLEHNIEAAVFLNARICFEPNKIPNEVDVLLVLPDQVLWLDVKGGQYFGAAKFERLPSAIETPLISRIKEAFKVMPQAVTFPVSDVAAMYVMDEKDYHLTVAKLTDTNQSELVELYLRSIESFIGRLADYRGQDKGYVRTIPDIVKRLMLPPDISIYETSDEFRRLGMVFERRTKKCEWYDELHTNSHYIRRYGLGHITDKYLDVKDRDSLFSQAKRDEQGGRKLQCSNVLLPSEVILLGVENRQINLFGDRKQLCQARWLYKVYPRLIPEADGPMKLKEVDTLADVQKLTLCRDYLQAIFSLVMTQITIEEIVPDALHLYKDNAIVVGVIEIHHGYFINDWRRIWKGIVEKLRLPEIESSLLLQQIKEAQPDRIAIALQTTIGYLNVRLEMPLSQPGPAPRPDDRTGSSGRSNKQVARSGVAASPPVTRATPPLVAPTAPPPVAPANPRPVIPASPPLVAPASPPPVGPANPPPITPADQQRQTGKIYVDDLPLSATEEELAKIFAHHGTVLSVKVIKDPFANQSRGFAFVEMLNEEQVQEACTWLNGTDLRGCTLTVNEYSTHRHGDFGVGRKGDTGDRGEDFGNR